MLFEFRHDSLQPLLEITAIAGTGQQRAHVERIDSGIFQHFRCFTRHDLARQTFGNGGLANARIAYQQRIVLAAPAKHLDATLNLRIATDQRINVTVSGLRVEVHAIFGEGRFLLFALGDALGFFLSIRCARNGAGFAVGRILGHTVSDIVDRIIARHVLLLQEVGGVRLTLGKDGDQNIGARHLRAARRLHVDGGALNDALESGGRHSLGAVHVGDEVAQVFIDELYESIAEIRDINRTGFHDLNRVRLIHQREQQMFQCCEFVTTGIGQRERRVDCLFECIRE